MGGKMSPCHCRWQFRFHVLTLLDGLGAGLTMVHTLTKPVGSPPAFVFYMGTQFSHLDYRVGMIGGKWGFRQMGPHSFEGGVGGNEQLLWENTSIQ